jgi:hypothetical protein
MVAVVPQVSGCKQLVAGVMNASWTLDPTTSLITVTLQAKLSTTSAEYMAFGIAGSQVGSIALASVNHYLPNRTRFCQSLLALHLLNRTRFCESLLPFAIKHSLYFVFLPSFVF